MKPLELPDPPAPEDIADEDTRDITDLEELAALEADATPSRNGQHDRRDPERELADAVEILFTTDTPLDDVARGLAHHVADHRDRIATKLMLAARTRGFTRAEVDAALDAAIDLDPSWRRVELGPALRGEVTTITPTVLRPDGAPPLFYRGHTNGEHGDSGIGKTFATLVAAAQEMTASKVVMWVDFENPGPTLVIERLRILGVADDRIAELLDYRQPTEAFDRSAVAEIERAATDHQASLIVVDSLGEAFGLAGIDENKDAEVAPWMREVPRRLEATGAAVVLLDHSTKAADNPLHPSGSKRKRAAITGASYLVDTPIPLTRERGGRLRLTCAKDRHGHHARGLVAAELEFTVYPDGGTTWHVWPPSKKPAAGPAGQLRVLARAVVRAVKDADRPVSQKELRGLVNVRASNEKKLAAIDHAVAEGAIATHDGPRRAVMHTFVRDLPEATE